VAGRHCARRGGADAAVMVVVRRCRRVWDVLWDWMFTTDLGNTYVGGLAGFGEGIVATVELLALLQLVLQQVLLVWEFAV